MDKPRLTGARQNGGGYVINAGKAIQDIRNPTLVELVDIDGDIASPDSDNLKLTAASGEYDSQKETLKLSQVVRLRSSRYTVDLHSAHIDFKTNSYDSNDPVTVVTNTGASIVSDSASVRDNADVITFEGHVRSNFQMNNEPGAAAPAKETQP
jgi:lipopolysaccharide export system protein LptC